jgi:uncharacterized DUF497 family protein
VYDSNIRMGRGKGASQRDQARRLVRDGTDAFLDPKRVIVPDLGHSGQEPRYSCFGWVDGGVMTVRFTWRGGRMRIIGAGYWRKGRQVYEDENG